MPLKHQLESAGYHHGGPQNLVFTQQVVMPRLSAKVLGPLRQAVSHRQVSGESRHILKTAAQTLHSGIASCGAHTARRISLTTWSPNRL